MSEKGGEAENKDWKNGLFLLTNQNSAPSKKSLENGLFGPMKIYLNDREKKK